jgi:hypothetical protein
MQPCCQLPSVSCERPHQRSGNHFEGFTTAKDVPSNMRMRACVQDQRTNPFCRGGCPLFERIRLSARACARACGAVLDTNMTTKGPAGDDAEGGDHKCAHVKADGHHEQVQQVLQANMTEVLSSQAHNQQAVAQREQQGAMDADGHVQGGTCKEGQVHGRGGENGDEQGPGLDDHRSIAAHRGRGQQDGAGARRHAAGADVADQVALSDPPGKEGASQLEPPQEEGIQNFLQAEPMTVSDDDDQRLVDVCAQRRESGDAVHLPGDSLGTCVGVDT